MYIIFSFLFIFLSFFFPLQVVEMFEMPNSPTALQYKYSFLSVSQLEGEDGPLCAQLLQHFKSNLEQLTQDTIKGKGARPGTKRTAKVRLNCSDLFHKRSLRKRSPRFIFAFACI